MELKGDFETLFISKVLKTLSIERKTGILRASNGDNEVEAFISDGEIVCVSESKKGSRLGELLRSVAEITSPSRRSGLG